MRQIPSEGEYCGECPFLELKGFQKGIAQAAGNIYTAREDIEED